MRLQHHQSSSSPSFQPDFLRSLTPPRLQLNKALGNLPEFPPPGDPDRFAVIVAELVSEYHQALDMARSQAKAEAQKKAAQEVAKYMSGEKFLSGGKGKDQRNPGPNMRAHQTKQPGLDTENSSEDGDGTCSVAVSFTSEAPFSPRTVPERWASLTWGILDYHTEWTFTLRDCWLGKRESGPNSSASGTQEDLRASRSTSRASPSRGSIWDEDRQGPDVVKQVWATRKGRFGRRASSHFSLGSSEMLRKSMMIHPDSFTRMLWAIMGLFFILLDVWMLSMAAFGIERIFFIGVTDCVYWSIDLVVCFFIGVHTRDGVDMVQSSVATKYLKSWFWFDSFLLIFQWLLVFLDTGSMGAGMLRYLRFTRFLRLLRLAKFNRGIRQLLQHTQSEWMSLALRLVSYLFSVAIWIHFSGSVWYWIGTRNADDAGWTSQYEEFETLPLSYLISVHWALSQLQGGIDVYPTFSPVERGYAVINLLASVAVLAMVVSKITNVLHEMQVANRERLRMFMTARRFMERHDIRSELSLQVYRYMAKHQLIQARVGEDEDEKDLLQRLPCHMRRHLLQEARWPVMMKHVLFSAFGRISERFKQQLLCDVLQNTVYLPDEVLFQYGQICPRMYVVVQGDAHYSKYGRTFANLITGSRASVQMKNVIGEGLARFSTSADNRQDSPFEKVVYESGTSGEPEANEVKSVSSPSEDAFMQVQQRHRQLQGCHLSSGTTLCESALFVNWAHAGDFEAVSELSLFTINISQFGELVYNFVQVQQAVRIHAGRFLQYLQNSDEDKSDLLNSEKVLSYKECVHVNSRVKRESFRQRPHSPRRDAEEEIEVRSDGFATPGTTPRIRTQ